MQFILFKKYFSKLSLPGGLRLWITLASLIFVAIVCWKNWIQLRKVSIDSEGWYWLLASFLFSILSILMNAIAWRSLVHWLENTTIKLNLIPLYLQSNLLKYLPGGIWHFVDRLRALRPLIGSGPALASVILEPFILASATLLWVPLMGLNIGLHLACYLPLIFLFTRWREPLLKAFERSKIKSISRVDLNVVKDLKLERTVFPNIRNSYPWKPFAGELLFLLLRFMGFWCCLNAFSLNSSFTFPFWLGGFAFAWTVGFVTPSASGGLGVFEAMIFFIFSNNVSEALLLVVALIYRIIVCFADISAAALVSYDYSKIKWT